MDDHDIKLMMINNPHKSARWIAAECKITLYKTYAMMRKLMPSNKPR